MSANQPGTDAAADAGIPQSAGDTTRKRCCGFLSDHQGKRSTMRLMSFVSLFASIAFGILTIIDTSATTNAGLYITTAFLLAAFAPKSLQRFAELNAPPGPAGGTR